MRFLSCKLSLLGKKSYYHQYFFQKIAPNMQVESSTTPLLTIDQVEKVQRQRIASFIGHASQLTYAAWIDKLIQQEKLNRFNGCSKRQPNTPFLALLFLQVRGNATRYPFQQFLTLAMSNNLTTWLGKTILIEVRYLVFEPSLN